MLVENENRDCTCTCSCSCENNQINNDDVRRTMINEIRSLDFAINELALYLDTHPDDQKALCLHRIQLIEIYDDKTVEDPLDTMMKKEYYKEIQNALDNSLSDFERKVLDRFIKGESYETIARKVDAPVKSVDNAIQRIRKKANKQLLDL